MRRGRRSSVTSTEDDVRSSLDLLDSVIGEFDDGATVTSVEIEPPIQPKHVRPPPPPKNPPTPPTQNKRHKDHRHRQRQSHKQQKSLNDKIDDIFSELTHEIYNEDQQQQQQQQPHVRQRSPVRRVNDPLPTPPSITRTPKSPIDVGSYGDGESDKMPPLTRSVKAQIHSLEKAAKENHNGKSSAAAAAKRSRSENPPAMRLNLSRNPTISPQPPPMPQKTKIHLKANSNSAASSYERKNPNHLIARSQSSKLAPNEANHHHQRRRQRRSPESSVVSSSQGNYEVVASSPPPPPPPQSAQSREARSRNRRTTATKKAAQLQQQEESNLKYRRSRSMGALEAIEQNRELQRGKTEEEILDRLKPAAHHHQHHIHHGSSEASSTSNGRRSRGVKAAKKKKEAAKEAAADRDRGRSLERGALNSPPTAIQAQEAINQQFMHRLPPVRQKSMLDLRDPMWEQQRLLHHDHLAQLHQQHQNRLQRLQRQNAVPQPGLTRSATEIDFKRNKKSSLEGLPMQHQQQILRRQMLMQREAAQHAAQAAAATGALPAPTGESLMMRQLNLEAQREFMMRRGGFSSNHPFISGEVNVHPELQHRLPFNGSAGAPPTRTIPMRPEDYQRFKPEFWLNPLANNNNNNYPHHPPHHHGPQPVAFRDLAVLQNELEVRRQREVQRQNSQRTGDGRSTHESEHGADSEFQSLPWEEVVLPPGMTSFAEKARKAAEKSAKKKDKKKSSSSSFSSNSQKNMKQSGQHWFLKEKEPPAAPNNNGLQSMPPVLGTLNDSGIGDDKAKENLERTGTSRSSFGIILKDKFQKNPNVYFPENSGHVSNDDERNRGRRSSEDNHDNSDTDTLIHNMSEGSFEKEDEEIFSGTNSSFGKGSSGNSSLSPHNSMEGSPRMKAKKEPQVTMAKKTIRNYAPKESSNMLKELEANRKKKTANNSNGEVLNPDERKTSVEKMIEDFHKNLPPPKSAPSAATTLASKSVRNGTMNSQISNWSVASSSASFDYQPGKKSSSHNLSVIGERVPPEGSDSADKRKFVQRIEVKAEVNPAKTPSAKAAAKTSPTSKNATKPKTSTPTKKVSEKKSSNSEVPKKLNKKEKENNSPSKSQIVPPAAATKTAKDNNVAEEDDDDFSNLRKLISEGRIAGLNEKPPAFTPPTPPTTVKSDSTAADSPRSQTNNNVKQKKKAPEVPNLHSSPSTSSSSGQSRPRKAKEAPPPPIVRPAKKESMSDEHQHNNPRKYMRESMEDLTRMDERRKKNAEIKRSPSNHETKTRYEMRREENMQMAQLIADSTEKKFNFNPFKGMWKKKHSFDFN